MTAEAEEEAGGGGGEGEAEVVVPEAAAEPPADEDSSTPEMPELLNPTREELEAAFPDIPQAPYPTLPDPREMTSKQIEAVALQDVNYGGLVRSLGGGRGGLCSAFPLFYVLWMQALILRRILALVCVWSFMDTVCVGYFGWNVFELYGYT